MLRVPGADARDRYKAVGHLFGGRHRTLDGGRAGLRQCHTIESDQRKLSQASQMSPELECQA